MVTLRFLTTTKFFKLYDFFQKFTFAKCISACWPSSAATSCESLFLQLNPHSLKNYQSSQIWYQMQIYKIKVFIVAMPFNILNDTYSFLTIIFIRISYCINLKIHTEHAIPTLTFDIYLLFWHRHLISKVIFLILF